MKNVCLCGPRIVNFGVFSTTAADREVDKQLCGALDSPQSV